MNCEFFSSNSCNGCIGNGFHSGRVLDMHSHMKGIVASEGKLLDTKIKISKITKSNEKSKNKLTLIKIDFH